MLEHFFIAANRIPANAATGHYEPLLVLFSYMIAALAAYVALTVLRHIDTSDARQLRRGRWLGALVMGGGIWSMHFIGMLAFEMAMAHTYHIGLTALSMLIAVVFSYFVFRNITRATLTLCRILLNAPVMGLGIASMHYIGMAAMRMDGETRYRPALFALSLLIAIGASGAAMAIMRRLMQATRYREILQLLAALTLAVAVCGLHYTGMAAAVFVPAANCRFDTQQHHTVLTVAVVVSSLLLIGSVLFLQLRWAIGKRPLSGGANPLNKLRMAGLCLAIMLPFLFTLYILEKNNSEAAQFTEMELAGIPYAQALLDLLVTIQGDAGGAPLSAQDVNRRTANRAEMAARVQALDDLQQIAHQLALSAPWQDIKQALAPLLDATPTQADTANLRDRLSRQLTQLIRTNYLNSKLILDPQAESYFIGEIAANLLPNLILDSARASAIGRATSSDGQLDRQTSAEINNTLGRIQLLLDNYRYDIDALMQIDTAYSALNTNATRAIANTQNLLLQMRALTLNTPRQDARIDSAVTQAPIAALHVNARELMQQLTAQLARRLHAQRTMQWIILAALLTGFLLNYLFLISALRNSAFKQELQFTQAIIDGISDPIFVKDSNHVWRAGNRAFWTLMGASADTFIGKNDHDLFPAEQVAIFLEKDNEVIRTGRVITNEEDVTVDGETFVSLTAKSPLMLPDGMQGLVGVIRDITTLKKNEAELKQHRENLESLVALQTKNIVAQKDKAEQASLAKSEFLSNMSHELRTPMHAILSYAGLGLEQLGNGGEAAKKLEKYLTNIEISGKRLLLLLNNLLDLSKMESGKMQFNRIKGDFNAVIQHALIELDALAKKGGQQIVIESTVIDSSACFDSARMIQVIINLLSNALKFAPTNTTVSVSLSEAQLADGTAALCCRVADQGLGIPKGELEIVFDKFVQSSKTKTGAGGTGLGLSISREIVEAHGGRIWAENGLLNGAIFCFLIPRY